MRLPRFKSVKSRFTFWFLLLSLAPLFLVGVIVYPQRVHAIKEEAFSKLLAIRDLKVEQINIWIDERISDVDNLAQDHEMQALARVAAPPDKGPDLAAELDRLRQMLARHVQHYRAYDEIFILHPRTGKVLLSSTRSAEGQDKANRAYFIETLRSGQPYVDDIAYSQAAKQMAMVFAAPIFSDTDQEKIVAILAARINLTASLYALLLDRTGMGATGETLLVNHEVVALNELRWQENAPLNLRISAQPSVRAARGETGVIEAADYRGKPVLAAYTYIPRTRWGFVAKQDQEEVYASVRKLVRNFITIWTVSGAAVLLISTLIARNIAAPVLEIAHVAQQLQAGEYRIRNRLQRADELGLLADSFNRMADTITLEMSVRQGVTELSGVMMAVDDIAAFARQVTDKTAELTGSELVAFYLCNKKGDSFVPAATRGITPELAASFAAGAGEGELGLAVASGNIARISEIPADTRFVFKTFTGTLLPREIISIPLLVKDEVRAVISLASLKGYSQPHLELINRVWPSIAIAFANLLANDATRQLAASLDATNSELQAQKLELVQQADELQEHNVELEFQRRQVEEANRLKGEFLSNMSHELRTPLNSIMALSRVLIMQAAGKLAPEEANYLEVIERNGRQLLGLINDILDLSKIEAGRMEINPTLFSLGTTLETIVENLDVLARKKGIEIRPDIPADLPMMESDETRVHQILQNILANAVKFTGAGHISVTAEQADSNIVIRIADTGIGIAAADLPHIFEEFRQADGSAARHYEGTGLGLAIARKAALLLGGEIRAQSEPGRGSIFTVTLPLRCRECAAASLPLPAASAVRGAFAPAAGRKVLIVDDDPETAGVIAGHLSRAGFVPLVANSGREALLLARSHQPYAITLDLIMPEMDGWEILQHLKDEPATAHIPVIIVSVSEDRQTGFALGAAGYLVKPVDSGMLISEIRRIGGQEARTIMVVDDNEIDRREMAALIEAHHMQAIAVDSGARCLELLAGVRPDLLLLDLIMPEMDGFTVLERLRSSPATGDLPVLVVTAKDLTAEERERLRMNAVSTLEKGRMTSAELLQRIETMLAAIDNSPEQPAAAPAAGRRLLLVEDNEAAIIQVKKVLEGAGHEVSVARGGREALDNVARVVPDGIILDLMMPEIDGFTVMEKIRANPATRQVPILVLTAKDLSRQELQRIKYNNIKQLIQKGDVDIAGLLASVTSMLGEQRAGAPETGGRIPAANAGRPARQPAKGGTALAEPPLILVVEDNEDNLFTLKAVLAGRYRLLEARDGVAGLDLAVSGRPDLVLLDMSLPEMDGYTVVRRLREEEATRALPVIALTAHAMKGDREKALAAGCDDYMSKPIEPRQLITLIEKWAG
jgi:CheY-like chemotaxis protein/signal transduction histidine kinase/HAMP domain-containing protein